MSEYTIVNVIPTSSFGADGFDECLHSNLYHGSIKLSPNGSIATARIGGDERGEVYKELISDDYGSLIYDAPIHQIDANEGEHICYVIIDYFEDTGSHHESELYEVTAFGSAEKIDEVEILNDLTGEQLEAYYEEEYSLETDIRTH